MSQRESGDPFKAVTCRLFGTVLTHVMASADLNPHWVARTAGLDRSYVYYVMRGGRLPRMPVTERLDKAVGADGLLVAVRGLIDQLADAACGTSAPEPVSVGPLVVGPWRLDVDEHGRLVAEHEDGTASVLAGDVV